MWAQLTQDAEPDLVGELGVAGGRQHPARAARRRDLGGVRGRSSATTSSPRPSSTRPCCARATPSAASTRATSPTPRTRSDPTSSPRTGTSRASPTRGAASRSPSTASRWRPCRPTAGDLSIWRATEQPRSVAPFATSLIRPVVRRRRLPLDRRQRRARRRPRLRPRLRLERPRVRAEADQHAVAGGPPGQGHRRRGGRHARAHRDDRPLGRRRAARPQRHRPGDERRAGGTVAAAAPGPVADPHPGRHVARPGRATPSWARCAQGDAMRAVARDDRRRRRRDPSGGSAARAPSPAP